MKRNLVFVLFALVSVVGFSQAAEFGKIIAGLDGQFGFVDVMDNVNGKNLNLSISVGYKF